MRALLALLFCLIQLGAASAEEPPFRAGFLTLEAKADPVVPVKVWYPTFSDEGRGQIGSYVLSFALNAPPAPGRHPVIVLSHDTGNSVLGHRELAAALARAGFVVVASTHLGDSMDHTEAHGTDLVYIGRAWQVVAALDAALADPRLAGALDAERVGMVGFGVGGYTALVVAGGKPDLSRWPLYCDDHMSDIELCGASSFPGIRITRPGWSPPNDRRIKALVAMAPLGLPFGPRSLDRVTVPVRLYEAENDRVLLREPNAAAILAALPRPPEHKIVPGGHFVFLDPCPPTLATMIVTWCRDPNGVDRAAIHRQLESEIRDFFERTL